MGRRNEVGSEPLLGQDPDREGLGDPRDDPIGYVFTGKLALFLLIMAMATGGVLVRAIYGDDNTQDVPGAIAILAVALYLAAMAALVALLFFVLIDISFSFSPSVFRVTKRGVFRSTSLEFSTQQCSLHFYRSHFSEDRAWLYLVVREGEDYYKICAWAGRGEQKQRFFRLFAFLRKELAAVQQNPENETPVEIVSAEEVTLIEPFTSRLKALGSKTIAGQGVYGRNRSALRARKAAQAQTTLSVSDIKMINYDKFFSQFSVEKKAMHEV